MITIIGLGNMGDKYKNTRHNIAQIILDDIVGENEWQKDKYANANIAKIKIDEKDVIFVKPDTFMNESGKIIPYFEEKLNIEKKDIVIIHDELDLAFGMVKISVDRGDAGHNGVKSIMNALGTKDFTRIRVGVSTLGDDDMMHKPDVLGNFSNDELKVIKNEIKKDVYKKIKEIVSASKE